MTEIKSDILDEAVEISKYIAHGMDRQEYSGRLNKEFLLKEAWNRIEYIGFETEEVPDPEEIEIMDFEDYSSLPYEFGSLKDQEIIEMINSKNFNYPHLEVDEAFPYIVIMDEAVRIVEEYSKENEELVSSATQEVDEMIAQLEQIKNKK